MNGKSSKVAHVAKSLHMTMLLQIPIYWPYWDTVKKFAKL